MLEFAVGVGVLSSLFTGTFQFGYGFYKYDTLYNAVRGAAAYAAMKSYDSSTGTPSDNYQLAVKNMVLYGNPSGTGAQIVQGLNANNISVSVTMDNNVPSTVNVKVTSYSIDTIFKTFTMTNKPSASFTYVGQFAPP
ncbi:MAG: pilus assembly protein [Candidatus Solibacter usitatus]|nr:pilus assembly protein [Candidatus Solibacter usitatus]